MAGRRKVKSDYWATSPCPRDQLTLFQQRLDDAIPAEHPVRLLADVLSQLDWSNFVARYHGRIGQPPIHPRILAAAIVYGLMCGVRSSRGLEETLQMRVDFRWLVEGHAPDHTTLSEFRRNFGEELKDLFVQIGLLAVELGITTLNRLAFDGTRIKANNRRRGTRTPAQLREMQQELRARFDELNAQAERDDAADDERFGQGTPHRLPAELADVRRRQRQIRQALIELDRLQEAGEEPPTRLPLTDPESRISPNKEGGFAPNYTPLAGVDVESGLIVTADVIPGTDEEQHLTAAVDEVEEQFGVKVKEVLADGLFATGANLEALEQNQVTLYSPSGVRDAATNPAVRGDPSDPVPEDQIDRLPMKSVQGKEKRFDKSAFVYDAERDVYWCPQGRPLTPQETTSQTRKNGTRVHRRRYRAAASDCEGCPLRARCLTSGETKSRQISRDQFEPHRERLAQRMATEAGQANYAERRHVGERPFGVIKQRFGARQFLLRGLTKVLTEWRWLATAFNLKHLIDRFRDTLCARAGPRASLVVA